MYSGICFRERRMNETQELNNIKTQRFIIYIVCINDSCLSLNHTLEFLHRFIVIHPKQKIEQC